MKTLLSYNEQKKEKQSIAHRIVVGISKKAESFGRLFKMLKGEDDKTVKGSFHWLDDKELPDIATYESGKKMKNGCNVIWSAWKIKKELAKELGDGFVSGSYCESENYFSENDDIIEEC